MCFPSLREREREGKKRRREYAIMRKEKKMTAKKPYQCNEGEKGKEKMVKI